MVTNLLEIDTFTVVRLATGDSFNFGDHICKLFGVNQAFRQISTFTKHQVDAKVQVQVVLQNLFQFFTWNFVQSVLNVRVD